MTRITPITHVVKANNDTTEEKREVERVSKYNLLLIKKSPVSFYDSLPQFQQLLDVREATHDRIENTQYYKVTDTKGQIAQAVRTYADTNMLLEPVKYQAIGSPVVAIHVEV